MITLTCIMGVDSEKFDLNLIYHFVQHYKNLGVNKFLVTVNADSMEKTTEGVNILKECGIEPVKIWIGTYLESTRLHELHLLQSMVDSGWILSVDSDEFVRINQSELNDVINECETKYIFCKGFFVDRLASNKKLMPVNKENNLFDQFPIESNVLKIYNKEKNMGACYEKCFLFKAGNYESGNGQHNLYDKTTAKVVQENYCYPKRFKVDHFKWTATCAYRLKNRIQAYSTDSKCFWLDEINWVYDNIKNNEIVKS